MDDILADRECLFKAFAIIEKRHQVSKRKLISFMQLFLCKNDMTLFKRSFAEPTKNKKTLNTLFRCILNASKFDIISLKEDIPQETKYLLKISSVIQLEQFKESKKISLRVIYIKTKYLNIIDFFRLVNIFVSCGITNKI